MDRDDIKTQTGLNGYCDSSDHIGYHNDNTSVLNILWLSKGARSSC